MADPARAGIPQRAGSFLRSPWAWRVGFVLLLALGLPRVARQVRACFFPPDASTERWAFFDFNLMMEHVRHYSETGVLYDTTGVDPYGPVTTSMLKYPPPHAALLLLMIPRDPPRLNLRIVPVEMRPHLRQMNAYRRPRPLVILYLASLVAALALVLAALKPGWKLGGLLTLLFLNWQPHWESMQGPQIEPFLLMLFTLSLLLVRMKRLSTGGIPVGIAGALKIYPWGAVFLFLLSRRGLRVVLGVLLGTVLAFAAATYYVPFRITAGYLLHILPRIGGGSGLRENVGALGSFSRLAYFLFGAQAPETLPLGIRDLARAFPPPGPALLSLVLWLSLCLPMVVLSVRALRRASTENPVRNDLLRLGLSTSLVLLLMPTVWSTYQTLLLLPLSVGIGLAPPPGQAKLTWGLLLFSGAAGAVNMGAYTMPVVVLRSLIPLGLWIACLRLLDAGCPDRPWSAVEFVSGSASKPCRQS
jgi:hypothetical protein